MSSRKILNQNKCDLNELHHLSKGHRGFFNEHAVAVYDSALMDMNYIVTIKHVADKKYPELHYISHKSNCHAGSYFCGDNSLNMVSFKTCI